MATFTEIVSNVTKHKCIPYCMVCFRTQNDQKLVNPVALAEFLTIGKIKYYSKFDLVCIVCESQALRAVKLYRAISLARDISIALRNLSTRDYTSSEIMEILPAYLTNADKIEQQTKMVDVLNMSRQMTHTEVLQVGSGPPCTESSSKANDNDSSAKKTVISKDIDSTIDTIVLDDDETITPDTQETHTESTPRLVPIEKLLKKGCELANNSTPANVMILQPVLPTFVLQPITVEDEESDDLFVFPTPIQQIQTNNVKIVEQCQNVAAKVTNETSCTLKSVVNVSDTCRIKSSRSLSASVNTTSISKPATIAPVQKNKVKSLPKITLKVSSETSANSNSVANVSDMCRIENPRSLLTSNNTTSLSVQKDSNSPVEKNSSLSGFEKNESILVAGTENIMTEPKLPVMDSSRIDWEDKIPMDVISFVNAMDPNPPELLNLNSNHGCSKKYVRKRKCNDVIELV